MFFAEAQIRVHLYGKPADMRKSYDGLQALVRHAMDQNSLDGSLYVFVNRRATQIKCLYFDRSGFCIWGKRLETGRYVSDWRHGKMQTGYFWPVYGEEDEVCFLFHPSRSADFVASALGLKAAVGSVLLTDGYVAYR